MLTVCEDVDALPMAQQEGAHGYLLKSIGADTLTPCEREITPTR
jgi:hypothetical protein